MPDFTERDALYADAVNRAALDLGGSVLPESYIRAARAGVDATLAALEARQILHDAADEIDAQNPARPAEPDTLESLIRAMVPIKHEPLATHVVNEWLERIRAVLGTITDAQVDAAAYAFYNLSRERTARTDAIWDAMPEDARASMRRQARKALEAAQKEN